jgi:hypothetical protein
MEFVQTAVADYLLNPIRSLYSFRCITYWLTRIEAKGELDYVKVDLRKAMRSGDLRRAECGKTSEEN